MHDPTGFVEPCVKELQLCGVQEGEVVPVLSQGNERLDDADASLAAARRLRPQALHVRLAEVSTSPTNDAGAWTVGETPLGGNRPAIEALTMADIVIDLVFLLFPCPDARLQSLPRRRADPHRRRRGGGRHEGSGTCARAGVMR